MSLDKLGLTLYDFLGRLFPGLVILFMLSVLEATFSESSILSFSSINEYLILATIFAYFLGHICHALGAFVRQKFYRYFTDQKNKLRPEIINQVRAVAKDTYGIELKQGEDLTNLDIYILAENWIETSGAGDQKEIFIAQEGFYKGTMVAVFLLSITAFISLIKGGMMFQLEPGEITQISFLQTCVFGAVGLISTLLFRERFMFFNRLKINKILVTFLASVEQLKP
jgi:hypothetical protein